MVDTSDSSFLSDLLLYRLIGSASLFDPPKSLLRRKIITRSILTTDVRDKIYIGNIHWKQKKQNVVDWKQRKMIENRKMYFG